MNLNFIQQRPTLKAEEFSVPPFQGQQQTMPEQPMPEQPQGLLGRIGAGIKRSVQDPNFMDRLTIGLGGMTMRPNTNLMSLAQNRINQRQKLGMLNATAKSVVAKLRSEGKDQMADMIEQNPSMASVYLNEIIKSQLRPELKKDTSPLQYDDFTGQAFYVQIGQDGKPKRINVEGAVAETPDVVAKRETTQKLTEYDVKRAQDMAADVFDQSKTIDSTMSKLYRIKDLVIKDGARTGIINQYLPSFDAATAELRGLASSLGIDIINSATFGALSEKELTLALSTGFDQSLQGQELVDYIESKLAAQTKLRNQLLDDAKLLSSGIGYQEYIQMRTSEPRTTKIPDFTSLTDEEMDRIYGSE